jgi:RHS repeat-associated protein
MSFSFPTSLRRLFCCALSYALIASLLVPPPARALESAVAAPRSKTAAAPAPAALAGQDAARRDGELIVRFRGNVSEEERNALAAAKGGQRKGKLRGESGAERLELQPGQDVLAAAGELRADPRVELAEPNYLVRRDEVMPNDQRFAEQWALKNTGQSGGGAGADIRATAAWQETTGSASTVIAVVDSGIDFSHPDLRNNEWTNTSEVADNGADDDNDGLVDDAHGWDWVADSGVIRDDGGHGTAVAGVIAAEGNNSEGVSGVMWHASLMSLRVLDSTGTGDTASATEAIDYAVAHGASVVNCSWGTDAGSQLLREAIDRAGKHGVVVVTSAGNNSHDIDSQPYYPASYSLPNVIAVAASDGFDNLASFSDWGPTAVAVAAPGTDILTTQDGGGYSTLSGTSASVPLVAGIAGLIKTLRPGASAQAVISAVTGGARQVNTLAGKVSSGGVADAEGALSALSGNPYSNSGNGGGNEGGGQGNNNGGGNGNSGAGNGQGNGKGQGYVPPALRHDNDHGRANGHAGLVVDPPAAVKGAPGAHLPDLKESRTHRTSPSTDSSATIHADVAPLGCADCDPAAGGGAGGSDPYFATARTHKVNETGKADVTLGSRNFNWALPLVSLPGRAGMDLSLSLYYNSLVWTAQGGAVQYNADHGTPAPGFQLGLPRLQGQYIDADSGALSFDLITPSGGRVGMRLNSTTGAYESADSTYTQLTYSGSTPVVRTTDGTQYVFGVAVAGGAEWRCTTVEDRNGNYISASYDSSTGHLLSVTDTLGRSVHFNYNSDGTLGTITQLWGGTWHTYVTFVYTTIQLSPNFPGLSVYGVPSGGSQTVLSFLAFADNESFHFDYNSYGQVYQIRHKAPDGHELGHTRYNISDADIAGAAQSDCPRFTAQYDYAQDWNNNQEAQTSYAVAADNTWSQVTDPDGTTYKELYYTSGWPTGLSYQTEVWSGGARKKYTTVSWTQDDTSLPYMKNPRIYETNVYDDLGHRSRTTIEYGVGYGLPTAVREWGGADGGTYLRGTFTAYRLDSGYLNQRLIGLVDNVQTYDGPTGLLVSKVAYQYDYGNEFRQFQANSTQHDATYDANFQWRGNCWSVLNFNADAPNDWGQIVEHRTGFNTDGSVIFAYDALGHQTTYSYADNFSDGNNSRGTNAYPTAVTDEDGYIAYTGYNYDFGGVTATTVPASGTTSAGVNYVTTAVQYDSYGRVQQETSQSSGTYRRYVYETNDNYVHTYQTITGTTSAYEFHSWVVKDGAGRVRAQASDHPGSVGGFLGQYINYDQMGRVSSQSNPTEMNSSWVATGDDSAWVYTYQTYDYKGRPLQTTNPDGSTKVFTYDGCGCAGGDVTTAQDEHGRQKRYAKDTLGRVIEVDELNWDGSVYATTTYTYNARDQVTQINQAGQTPRTFGYDGHGRLTSSTTPEQGTTNYSYNTDDTVNTVTDARGATQTFGYSGRHLVTSVTYGVPSGVAATSNVAYAYDAAGNRTSMTEQDANNNVVGSTTYHYDSLSRMDWEQRTFSGVGTFQLSYGYNVGGELTSVTNPWGAQVSYTYDTAGRLNAVNGANYAGVSNYTSSMTYRAFGSLKGMSFSNGHTLSTAYDNRMRPTTWNVSGVLGYNYNYNYLNEKTGRVSYAQSIYDSREDRSYEYDNVGRLAISHSGAEARAHVGLGPWGTMDGPYSQGYDYDVWGNVTHRYGWGGEVQGGTAGQSSDHYYYYANNRRTDNGFTYDSAGDLTFDGGQHFTYDAAGRQTYVDWTNLSQGYDGDGLRVKKSDSAAGTVYYLRSTVLGGQVVAELNSAGGWARGYVYSGSQLLAVQQNGVFFVHEDPITKSKRVTDVSGVVQSAVELDPYGGEVSSFSSNTAFQPRKFTSYERDANGTDEAMMRRYNRYHSRFDQPDPYGGSYETTDPQTLNRYAYTHGDPVNFTDPTGLDEEVGDGDVVSIFQRMPPWPRGGGAAGGGIHAPLMPTEPNEHGGGGGVRQTASGSSNLSGRGPGNPNSRKCQALAQKIANIQSSIVTHTSALIHNPNALPEFSPTGRIRDGMTEHRDRLLEEAENLADKIKQYKDECGGGNPPTVPPVNAPRSFRSRSTNFPNGQYRVLSPQVLVPVGALILCIAFLEACLPAAGAAAAAQ